MTMTMMMSSNYGFLSRSDGLGVQPHSLVHKSSNTCLAARFRELNSALGMSSTPFMAEEAAMHVFWPESFHLHHDLPDLESDLRKLDLNLRL